MPPSGKEKSFLAEIISDEFGTASDPWPNDAQVYLPHETDQALLYQFAESLSVRAFLHMCDLPFTLQMKPNAEQMSPSGEVPFLRVNSIVVAGFSTIVDLVAKKGIKLYDFLPEEELAELRAHICLVQEMMNSAEMYICWLHDPIRDQVTRQRYGSVFSWPLNRILPWLKYRQMRHRLELFGWAKKTLPEVLDAIDKCCNVLASKLGKKNYFFSNDRPTELDALVFGHLYTIFTTELPDVDLPAILKKYPTLLEFCQRIDRKYFTQPRD